MAWYGDEWPRAGGVKAWQPGSGRKRGRHHLACILRLLRYVRII